jgi:sigma-B regulation protein RsbQ
MQDISKRNNIKILGLGTRPMIMVHGFGCDQNMWRYVVPVFEEKYKIILLDLVGTGMSDLSAFDAIKYKTLHGYAEDIVEICDFLNLSDVILVGHSVSAMICTLAHLKRPNLFSGLIMVGPSPRYINDKDYIGGFEREDIEELIEMMDNNYLGWSAATAPAIMGNPENPALGEELTNSFCQTDPNIAKHFATATFFSDNRSDIPKISIPTLILQCSEDIIAPETVGLYLKEHIKNNKFVHLKAAGHCPHMSAPSETTGAMQDWLTETEL